MVTLKSLKTKLDSSNIFYGVLRVVKMISMAKFNETTKHAKVRDLSLRISIRMICNYDYQVGNSFNTYWGILTNSGKCGALNVNVMDAISKLLSSSSKIVTYGKKGYSLFSSFSNYSLTIFESGNTSMRNLIISSRLLNCNNIDFNHIIVYNRYYGMTNRSIALYKIYSYDIFKSYVSLFTNNSEIKNKLLYINSSGRLVNLYDYLIVSIFLNALYENDLSECSTRIQCLETALKNLEKIIEDLRITYNKRRQGSITNELLEVIASTISI